MTIFDALLKEREALLLRLLAALDHLPRKQQLSILASYLSMNELRELVTFQERK